MKLLTFLLVTGIAAIIVAGCMVTQPAPVLLTPQKDTEAARAIAVTSSASPVANDPDNPKFASTPILLRPTASASRVSRPTLTSTPIAPPTVPASAHVTLTLTLKLNKNTYNLKEPVTASLQLTNAGNESVFIHKRMVVSHSFYPVEMRDVVFVIIDPAGETLSIGLYYDLALPEPTDFGTLDPGESIEITPDLRYDYGLALPGEYSIQAIYQNQSNSKTGKVAWKGELRSNAVERHSNHRQALNDSLHFILL